MADLNRYFIQKDRERIENYIDRKNLSMTESSTGLWYFIRKEGQGRYLTDYDRIVMEYNCSLLDGSTCYSSENDGVKEVILGKSELEAGLNQGLRMLRTGGEAVFIIPPFLAHGLTGDGNKIPPRSVIVYNVKILQVQKYME
jgi:FKBP-type peptidyl-prolyl cis-trans isomerase